MNVKHMKQQFRLIAVFCKKYIILQDFVKNYSNAIEKAENTVCTLPLVRNRVPATVPYVCQFYCSPASQPPGE